MPTASRAPPALRDSSVAIRPLRTPEELAHGVAIQRETWGGAFTELVPATILMICQKVGGLAAGAFDATGHMLGFVFGLTGLHEGTRVHWSHMLAVRPEARGLGLGRRLKLYQRDELLKLDVEEVRWTYDPLVAQNAHLNLNDLGVTVERYVPNMYGTNTGSALHSALGTDRFVVLWRIADPGVAEVVGGRRPALPAGLAQAPAVTATLRDGLHQPAEQELPRVPVILVDVPEDIQQVRERSLEAAGAWRTVTRRAFTFYLEHGYGVTGFRRDPTTRRCTYVMQRIEARP